MKAERALPLHLAENKESKCFVFRHSKHRGGKTIVISYAHGKSRGEVREKAIKFTNRMNRKLPLPSPTSTEDRMSSRNTSHVVGVNPAKSPIQKLTGAKYIYYSRKAKWVGCPQKGGVSWPCKTHGCKIAYALAVPTRRSRNQKLNETWRQAGWKLSSKTCSLFGREILTRKMRTISRRRILEELETIKGTERYRSIVSQKPIHKGCDN